MHCSKDRECDLVTSENFFRMQNNNSLHSQRQRKALLLLPLVAIPALCFSFYALGGGKRTSARSEAAAESDHFNAKLPDAHFSKQDALVDKLGFYEKADEDSAKKEMRMRADPYHSKELLTPGGVKKEGIPGSKFNSVATSPLRADTAAERLLEKLDRLKKIVNGPAPQLADTGRPVSDQGNSSVSQMSRLEGMMKTIQAKSADDPQLDKLNGMLDKILKIQHPESSADAKPRDGDTVVPAPAVSPLSRPESSEVYTVDSAQQPDDEELTISGFQEIATEPANATAYGTAIPAIVPEDQTMVTGATLKLRTQKEAIVGSIAIPKNSLLYGRVAISGERMLVSIGSVRIGAALYPVDLEVFDMDGLAGIHIPGAISRDVAKESAEQGVSSAGTLGTLDQSLGAQAATASIQAAKTLFSRKVKLVRAQVRSGYLVFIKSVKNK